MAWVRSIWLVNSSSIIGRYNKHKTQYEFLLQILLYLFKCFFYIFFRGFLFYQLGPGPTKPSDAETEGFKISLHFTLVFLFRITCIVFWVISWHFSIFHRLEACQASRGVGLRRLRWPLPIWTPAPNKWHWARWPRPWQQGFKLRLLHDAGTNNKTIQLQEVQRVSNINYIATV